MITFWSRGPDAGVNEPQVWESKRIYAADTGRLLWNSAAADNLI